METTHRETKHQWRRCSKLSKNGNGNADIAIAQKAISQSTQNFQGSSVCHYSDFIKKICGRIINGILKKTLLDFHNLFSPN